MKQSHKDDQYEQTGVQDQPDKARMLLHSIYEAPDKSFWKIPEKEPNSSHPGICWHVDQDTGKAVMFKGTSQQPKKARYLISYAVLAPNESNGLDATTYFRVDEPRLPRVRQLELMHHDRLRGSLAAHDVAEIELALNELKGASHVDG
ncbi:hypothetical protein CA51_13560 [Rosistilla oblonga]|uniref:hypothetical protein n=1 Tax=Rosistilla oblonga TaxID=2527990 RepID=UPI00118CB9CD|nr:hypothetical protein [Rosistilla oblonga]QDV11492.1 hypothetical protein CA51_13560 [Rosistilla oblonga]